MARRGIGFAFPHVAESLGHARASFLGEFQIVLNRMVIEQQMPKPVAHQRQVGQERLHMIAGRFQFGLRAGLSRRNSMNS